MKRFLAALAGALALSACDQPKPATPAAPACWSRPA